MVAEHPVALAAAAARKHDATRERATELSLRQRVRSLLDENQRLRGETAELRTELALA
jgi:hypothetical protein